MFASDEHIRCVVTYWPFSGKADSDGTDEPRHINVSLFRGLKKRDSFCGLLTIGSDRRTGGWRSLRNRKNRRPPIFGLRQELGLEPFQRSSVARSASTWQRHHHKKLADLLEKRPVFKWIFETRTETL